MKNESKSQPFIVGRQSEVNLFAALAQAETPHNVLNIYGPGGIGKTVVGQKIQAYAAIYHLPLAFVDGIRQDLTPLQILSTIHRGFIANAHLAVLFSEFERQYQEYELVQEMMQVGGGVQTMYNPVGMPQDPQALEQMLSSLSSPVSQQAKQVVSNRFALQRYLRGIEKNLTGVMSNALATATTHIHKTLTILIDTYEELEEYDDWICRHLYPALPDGMKLVILGRNALSRVNFDWSELGDSLRAMELPELSEKDTKTYLRHYGLEDDGALDQVYRFTGGYPLLLVLVVHLSREAGGWQNIGALEHESDRDRVATWLLERILREERVQEVRVFLEKGVLARWFNPEVVSKILGVSVAEGQAIYNKLYRHSFVERHPNGLKFHDKIRELLETRLKFSDPTEYNRLSTLLQDYYAEKAGVVRKQDVNPTAVMVESQPSTFGQLLAYYRRQARDPKRGGPLTQKRLADLLAEIPGGGTYADVTISHWEHDKVAISHKDRPLLLSLVYVLHQCGGIPTIEEANRLLFVGGYRNLSMEEQEQIF